jgi:hypothetical protein
VVVKSTAAETASYAHAAARSVPERRAASVSYRGFGEGFLPSFLEALHGRNNRPPTATRLR